MFTGADPQVHGVKWPDRPVLTCDTLFDALIRAGKKPAIVAVAGSSIDRLFRNRSMDYFSEPYDPQVTDRVLSLLHDDRHDFIVAYHQEYDDALHRTTPHSDEAVRALQHHLDSFARLAAAVHSCWASYHRLILFAPDHGGHLDPDTGKGTHGLDIPEDMLVRHAFALARAQNPA
jgi:hypothetical protein